MLGYLAGYTVVWSHQYADHRVFSWLNLLQCSYTHDSSCTNRVLLTTMCSFSEEREHQQKKIDEFSSVLHLCCANYTKLVVHLEPQFRASLVTEQLYTPASLSARLLISSCELSLVLVTLLPSPRRNKLPSFSQWISGAGMPVQRGLSQCEYVVLAGRCSCVGEIYTWLLCISSW